MPFVLAVLSLVWAIALSGCGVAGPAGSVGSTGAERTSVEFALPEENEPASESAGSAGSAGPGSQAPEFDLATVPRYSGTPYAVISDNVPAFADADYAAPAETYAPLDELGRCGVATAIVSRETMPTEKRGSIGMVKPSGWHTVRYDDLIADRYLYNRCHLVGFQLAGENANERNLITGTRYMNVEGMLPFENQVADYVEATGNRVLYRVTPVFVGDELVARGVHMEAISVEDGGAGVSFNVFCYNVQPGIEIDYATGESWRASDERESGESESGENESGPRQDAGELEPRRDAGDREAGPRQDAGELEPRRNEGEAFYVVNTRSGKFHLPSCPGVKRMSDSNRVETSASRDELISRGYDPCGTCRP